MAKLIEVSGNATTVETEYDVGANLEALINDGADDIVFGIDAGVSSIQRRTLKAGEQVSLYGYGVPCGTIWIQSASGSQPFRVWGTKD